MPGFVHSRNRADRIDRIDRIDRTRREQLGQSLVEFALVLPILLLIFAAAADFGRAFYGYVALENAVKEGAIYGARYPLCSTASTLCPDPDNVRWRVENEARNLKNTDGTFKITPASSCLNAASGTAYADLRNCVAGDTYVVQASLTFNLITPMLDSVMGGGFTFTSESRAPVLNAAFDPTPGLAGTKLVLATNAKNFAEVSAKCQQPDPTGSPNYYRSPCLDTTGVTVGLTIKLKFQEGDTINYKIIVRNNGGTNVTSVTMTDSLGWSCPTPPTSMPVGGAPFVCSYSRTAPAPSGGVSGDYVNMLTVDGLEVDPRTDTAIVTVEAPPAKLRVLKFVSVYALGDDGDGVPSFGITDTASITFNAATPSPFVWYKIAVTNTGGQPATGLSISDTLGVLPYGQSNATAVCDAKPTTLAKNATFTCRYRVSYSAAQVRNNTAAATATNVTPDFDDSHTATVTVTSCAAANKVVPNLIGLARTPAQTAWTTAGFTGTYNNFSGGGNVVTQSVEAFSCKAATTPITVTKATTP